MNLYQVTIVFLNALLVAIECKQRVTRVPSEDEIICNDFANNNPLSESKNLTKSFVVRCLNTMFNQNSIESTGDKRNLDIASLFSDLEKLVASKNISISPFMAINSTDSKGTSLSIMNERVTSSYLDQGEPSSSTNLRSPDQNMRVKIAPMNEPEPKNTDANAQKGMAPMTIEGLASNQIPPGNLKVSFPLQILHNFKQLIGKTKHGKQTTASTGDEGMCVNKKSDCISWAREGECHKNPKFMIKNCHRSCSGCAKCEDKRTDSCFGWAKVGECKKNRRVMELLCWKTCSNCAPCTNKHTQCAEWAKQDECKRNHLFMHEYCWRSCSNCAPCKNTWGLCTVLAANGFCSATPTFMNNYCWKSCSNCAPCVDKHKNCADWAGRGFCTTNPRYMENVCWRSCSGCCRDKGAQCAEWAKKGECDKNQNYMGAMCPKSCNKC